MKLAIGILVIALSAVLVPAQQTTVAMPAARADETKARVVAELASAGRVLGGIKNMPFSADEINESVQTLADGNRIVRSSTGKIYRNSEGVTRRDLSGGTGGVLSSTYSLGGGVSMITPRADATYLLDAQRKTAVEMATQAHKELAIAGVMSAQAGVAEERMRAELRAAAAPVPAVPPVPPVPVIVEGQAGVYAVTSSTSSKYETTTEQLGVRDFEGVSAEGTRRTTIIPAGAIGNDRPIEIVYERWYSKDLGMVVYSRNSDPRFGEQTYRLTNIVRAEPDPSLFQVPQHYRKVSGGGTLYRATPKPAAVKTTATGTVQRKIKPQYFN